MCRQVDALMLHLAPLWYERTCLGGKHPQLQWPLPLHAQTLFCSTLPYISVPLQWILQQFQGLHPSDSRAPPLQIGAALGTRQRQHASALTG